MSFPLQIEDFPAVSGREASIASHFTILMKLNLKVKF